MTLRKIGKTPTEITKIEEGLRVTAKDYNYLAEQIDTTNAAFLEIAPAVGTAKSDIISEYTAGEGVVVDGVLMKDGEILNNTDELLSGAPLINGVKPSNWIVYFDDFISTPYDEVYDISVTDAIGGSGLNDVLGGEILISATNTDNYETYFSSLNEPFIFDATRKVYFEAKLKLTEAATDDSNWIIGLSDTVAANSLLDNGGGPMASYDGAVFFKVDGTMKIQFETSTAATQVTNATLATFVSGTSYRLGFLYEPGATNGTVTPYVDGVAGTPHALPVAGLAAMHILMGMKNGGSNAETLQIDYIYVAEER